MSMALSFVLVHEIAPNEWQSSTNFLLVLHILFTKEGKKSYFFNYYSIMKEFPARESVDKDADWVYQNDLTTTKYIYIHI